MKIKKLLVGSDEWINDLKQSILREAPQMSYCRNCGRCGRFSYVCWYCRDENADSEEINIEDYILEL